MLSWHLILVSAGCPGGKILVHTSRTRRCLLLQAALPIDDGLCKVVTVSQCHYVSYPGHTWTSIAYKLNMALHGLQAMEHCSVAAGAAAPLPSCHGGGFLQQGC